MLILNLQNNGTGEESPLETCKQNLFATCNMWSWVNGLVALDSGGIKSPTLQISSCKVGVCPLRFLFLKRKVEIWVFLSQLWFIHSQTKHNSSGIKKNNLLYLPIRPNFFFQEKLVRFSLTTNIKNSPIRWKIQGWSEMIKDPKKERSYKQKGLLIARNAALVIAKRKNHLEIEHIWCTVVSDFFFFFNQTMSSRFRKPYIITKTKQSIKIQKLKDNREEFSLLVDSISRCQLDRRTRRKTAQMLADLVEITVCPSAFVTEARQSLRDAEKRKYGMKISKKRKRSVAYPISRVKMRTWQLVKQIRRKKANNARTTSLPLIWQLSTYLKSKGE